MEVKGLVVSAVNKEGWEQTHECEGLLVACETVIRLSKLNGVSSVKLSAQSGRGLKEIGNTASKPAKADKK